MVPKHNIYSGRYSMNKKRQKEEEEEEYFAGDNFLQKIKQYKSQSKVIKKKNT